MSSTIRRRAYSTVRDAVRHKRRTRLSVALAGGTAVVLAYNFSTTPLQAEIKVEAESPKRLDYSQHAQVSMSWERPGCYVWGSNKKGVSDPFSSDAYAKIATRISAFDGMALRDLKVNENIGVAVLDSGDVYQWGQAYHGVTPKRKKGTQTSELIPEATLKGKDIRRVELGANEIYCLSKKGEVYVLPYSREEQQSGGRVQESKWFGLSSAPADISYKTILSDLTKGDSIKEIAAGLDHLVLLSRFGTVFTAAPSIRGNVKGQLGITNWQASSDEKTIRSCEVTGFKKNSKSIAIAAGDHHSVVLDEDGEVFTFGSNAHGQLAFDFNAESSDVSTPTMVSVASLYPRNYAVKCLKIAAGGKNTYMVIENQQYGKPYPGVDVWASGMGQFGSLGNNTWNHYQAKPVRVKVISGLSEWDEVAHKVSPIGVHSLSVGSTHTICCLDNYSKVDADAATGDARSSFHDVNYGRDVFVWGGNDSYQIGANGKRNNRPMPEYISPMEQSATDLAVKSGWEEEGHKRFQLTPRKVIEVTTSNGKRVKRNVEQAIIAGDKVSACYMKLVE